MVEDSRKMKMMRCLLLLSAAREGVITLTNDDKDYIKEILNRSA